MATSPEPGEEEGPASEGGIPSDVENISLDGVTKTFDGGSIVACQDIDLDISPDDFVVLLGPSGCGKTTTLRCIAGLEIPDGGTIAIGGRDVTDAKPKDRNLAFVFQSIALFPHMSVRGNIQFGLDMKTDLSDEEKRERVEEAGEILGIGELLDRQPSELSGGQQQRVSLGRAMVMEPAAFLLDEPFSALDANLRDQMQTEIKRLHRELETAMIFVTHDQEEAMTLGDKIVVMNDGNIQQVGSPYEIYNDPINRFVAEFIGSPSANMLEATLEDHDGELVAVTDSFDLALPDADRTPEIDRNLGETVTLGIRPEYVELVEDGAGDFEAEITLVEPQGARDAVFLSHDGTDLRATTQQGTATETETIGVRIDPGNAWLFDAEGDRLV